MTEHSKIILIKKKNTSNYDSPSATIVIHQHNYHNESLSIYHTKSFLFHVTVR